MLFTAAFGDADDSSPLLLPSLLHMARGWGVVEQREVAPPTRPKASAVAVAADEAFILTVFRAWNAPAAPAWRRAVDAMDRRTLLIFMARARRRMKKGEPPRRPTHFVRTSSEWRTTGRQRFDLLCQLPTCSSHLLGLIFSFFPPVLETQRARTKMADTAAFFAKKKKKGKKKAFNANLVDIAAVTSSTHV